MLSRARTLRLEHSHGSRPRSWHCLVSHVRQTNVDKTQKFHFTFIPNSNPTEWVCAGTASTEYGWNLVQFFPFLLLCRPNDEIGSTTLCSYACYLLPFLWIRQHIWCEMRVNGEQYLPKHCLNEHWTMNILGNPRSNWTERIRPTTVSVCFCALYASSAVL